MSSDLATSNTEPEEVFDKNSPGRGSAVIIYGLYIGSIIAVVTAPIGVLIAHFYLGRGAAWVDTHLRFQIRTFWLGVLAAAIALLLWQLAGLASVSPMFAWSFGYLFFTLAIIWMMGRCAVGVQRLMSNQPIAAPKSWLFGCKFS